MAGPSRGAGVAPPAADAAAAAAAPLAAAEPSTAAGPSTAAAVPTDPAPPEAAAPAQAARPAAAAAPGTAVEHAADPPAAAAALAVPAAVLREAARDRGGVGGAIAGGDKIGDILFVPPDSNLCIGDMCVINPCAATYSRHAAGEDGSGARLHNQERAAYPVGPTVCMTGMHLILGHCLMSVIVGWAGQPWST